MSRTDKDEPWWVIAQWWEPEHYRCSSGSYGWRWGRPCDLPPKPIRTHPAIKRHCHWEPLWPEERRHYIRQPPQWYIDHIDTSPTRTKVRDDCRRAVQEYRATGEVDVIPPTNQHRHCATWYYNSTWYYN